MQVPPQMLREHMKIHRSAFPDAEDKELEELAHQECLEFLEKDRAEEEEKVAALVAVAKKMDEDEADSGDGGATSSSCQALPRPSELPQLSAAHQVRVADFFQIVKRKRPPVNLEPPVSWTSAAASASTPPPVAPQADLLADFRVSDIVVLDSWGTASERKRARKSSDGQSPVGRHSPTASPDLAD